MKSNLWPGIAAALIGLSGLSIPAGAQAATAVSIAYTRPYLGDSSAYVVDFKAKGRVRVATIPGAAEGSFTDDGVQRVVSLSAPISATLPSADCNGNEFAQRYDTNQIVFRRAGGGDRKGSSAVVEIGTITDIGGCTPGLVTPFGALTDAGMVYNNLGMGSRPPLTDLVPGSQLAGPSMDDFDAVIGNSRMTQQIVKFDTASSLSIPALGITLPYAIKDGWIAYTATGEIDRRYTRLSQNTATGVEVWLASDFVGGLPGKTTMVLMTKPTAGATFGSVKQSAHEWDSGLFVGAPNGLFFDFYKDFTGLRVARNTDGSFTPLPITWAQSGNKLVNSRMTGVVKRIRTWAPIGTYGNNHFVFEDEYFLYPDGTTYQFIVPRVNFYVDKGPAVPPASLSESGASAALPCRLCNKSNPTGANFGRMAR
jgi:hypothetical protein